MLALLIAVTDKIILQIAVVMNVRSMNVRSERTSFTVHSKSCFTWLQVFKTVLGEMVRANVVELHMDLLRYSIDKTSAMPV